jgi:hypothetical protein
VKNLFMGFLFTSILIGSYAQVGIKTISPNPTLQVIRSFSSATRSFAVCPGRIYFIRKGSIFETAVICAGSSGSENIDGNTNITLITQYTSYMIQPGGGNWNSISKN